LGRSPADHPAVGQPLRSGSPGVSEVAALHPRLLAWSPTAGVVTDCWRGHRLLAWSPTAGVVTDCWRGHRDLFHVQRAGATVATRPSAVAPRPAPPLLARHVHAPRACRTRPWCANPLTSTCPSRDTRRSEARAVAAASPRILKRSRQALGPRSPRNQRPPSTGQLHDEKVTWIEDLRSRPPGGPRLYSG
jgi:hypothetical protein